MRTVSLFIFEGRLEDWLVHVDDRIFWTGKLKLTEWESSVSIVGQSRQVDRSSEAPLPDPSGVEDLGRLV